MAKRKRVSEKHEIHRNAETGEVIEESKITQFSSTAEPSFVKLYLEDLVLLSDLPRSSSNLLYALLHRMDFENYITLSPLMRKRICEQCGISSGTLRNALTGFCDSKIFIREDTNTYFVNPGLFAKGTWRDVLQRRDRFKQLALKITYSETTGRRVNSMAVTETKAAAGEDEHS